MKEIIYVLTNECMPGLVKIGRTSTSLQQRMRELFNTSIPYPFECFFAAWVDNASVVEKKLHFAFGEQRVPSNREFFRIDPNRVKAVLELVAIEEVTPQVESVMTQEMKEYNERRPAFRFSLAKVPIGAELQFVRDDTISCRVTGDKTIEFRGVETSLSSAASNLLQERGWKSPQVQGPIFWLYEGETLEERRQKNEGQV